MPHDSLDEDRRFLGEIEKRAGPGLAPRDALLSLQPILQTLCSLASQRTAWFLEKLITVCTYCLGRLRVGSTSCAPR